MGALWLWLIVIAVPLLLWQVVVASVAASAGPRLSPFARPDVLLAARHGKRVVVHHLPGFTPLADGALCQLAQRNGEALPSPAAGDGQQRSCGPAGGADTRHALSHGLPGEQCAALRSQGASFVTLDTGLSNTPYFDGGALYVLVLRSPRERYLAEIDALPDRKLDALLPLRNATAQARPTRLDVLRALSNAPRTSVPRHLRDNALVRHLAGSTARGLPLRGVTQQHLLGAQARMAHFDALLLTHDAQRGVAHLAQRLGWRYWDITRGDRRRQVVEDELTPQVAALSREERMHLDGLVVYDDLLYQAAIAALAARAPSPVKRDVWATCASPRDDGGHAFGLGRDWAPLPDMRGT